MNESTNFDYPIIAELLEERVRMDQSPTLDLWIEEARRGLEALEDPSPRMLREAESVRRALELASGLVEILARAATRPRESR